MIRPSAEAPIAPVILGSFFVVLALLVLAGRDARRLRRALARLAAADREKSAVLAALPEPVVLLAVDATVVRRFGPDHPDLAHLHAFLAGPQAPHARAAVARALAGPGPHTLDLGPGPDARRCELRLSRYNAGTVLAFLRDVTEQRRLDRRLLDEVAAAQQRMGSDLHDGLCQQLTGLLLLAQALEGAARRGEPVGLADIRRLREHLAESAVEARQLSQSLFPVVLRQHGLVDALRQLCDATAALHGVRCTCTTVLPRIDLEGAAIHLYRIAQEAVTNAVRHARPASIVVTLTITHTHPRTHPHTHPQPRDLLVLTIADDGVGLPPASARRPGMGLHSMAHRAEAIGALLALSPRPGGGTEVRVELPLAEAA